MLTEEVLAFLKGVDISVLSLNDIILQLKERFEEDFTDEREYIEQVLADLNFPQDRSEDEHHADYEFAQKLQEQERRQSKRKPATSSEAPKKKLKYSLFKPASNPFNKVMNVSASLQKVIGLEEATRPQVMKLIWKYIKENNLQDPNDRRYVVSDDKLYKIFKRKRLNCFKISAELSHHLYFTEDVHLDRKREPEPEHREHVKLVRLPERWVDLGLKPEMTYHQLQLDIVHLLREHRTPEDPDTVSRPETEHVLCDLMPQGKDACATADIFRNLRVMFKDQLVD